MIARGVRTRMCAFSICLSMLMPGNLEAFLFPLREADIREAYFLGTGHREKAAAFLGEYVREYPRPAKGAWVYRIEFRTPYEEVVRRSWEKTVGYSAQQAKKDYDAGPDLVLVRIEISFAVNYTPGLASRGNNGQHVRPSEDFAGAFPVRVTQTLPIVPGALHSRLLYSRRRVGPSGVELLLEFSAKQFGPSTAHVEVMTPEGETVQAEFDLDKLK